MQGNFLHIEGRFCICQNVGRLQKRAQHMVVLPHLSAIGHTIALPPIEKIHIEVIQSNRDPTASDRNRTLRGRFILRFEQKSLLVFQITSRDKCDVKSTKFVLVEKLSPPIHTGCAGAYAQRYARSVRGSKFAVFGALRLFRVRVTHACSDMVRNVVRECVARNHVWVSTPKICTMHDVVTGCGIPNKFKLFSNC